MAQQYIALVPWRVRAYKLVPLAEGRGHTTYEDGWIEGNIEVTVDPRALVAAAGYRALRIKAHKSVLQSGAVTFIARDVKRVPEVTR